MITTVGWLGVTPMYNICILAHSYSFSLDIYALMISIHMAIQNKWHDRVWKFINITKIFFNQVQQLLLPLFTSITFAMMEFSHQNVDS